MIASGRGIADIDLHIDDVLLQRFGASVQAPGDSACRHVPGI